MDLRQRFDAFAARFTEPSRPVTRLPPGSGDDYWRHVADLFTRDVTEKGIVELVERDTQDTFQFFTREIDFTDLQARRWYERWPQSVWRVFLTIAFRLSPARRLLFAAAVPLLAAGWVTAIFREVSGTGVGLTGVFPWVLLSATILFLLLVLELKDKLALKGDLEIAREIQFGLLPFDPFERRGTTICASMRPANTVGGDYFDIIDLGEERVAIVMGDVAGKGIPAALLMALLQGSLRTLLNAGLRGAPLVGALNDHLHANIPSNRLITLFYSELDLLTGVLLYVNAGHNAPRVLRGSGRLETLGPTGVALGVVHGLSYDCGGVDLAIGDTLFLYTDGVTEAFDARDEEFGEERLDAVLQARRVSPPAKLVDAVRDEVLGFCGFVKPRDDMTLLAVHRGPAPPAAEQGAGESSDRRM